MIKRDVFKTLELELNKKQITAIVGARQIGKTTAMKYIFDKISKESVFLSFEDKDVLKLFEDNIKLFIEQYVKPYKYIFIDEFQYAKDGGKSLKLIYDMYWKKIFISGSSKPELAIHSLGFLVGRVSIIEMNPLTFTEFVEYKSPEKIMLLEKNRTTSELKQLQAEFEEFILYGGYPQIVIEINFNEKQKLLKNIVQTYLFREIKEVLGYKENYIFENILKRLALQNGKLCKISNLSRDLNVNWNKLSECVNVLIQTGIIIEVKPFFTNKAKELMKTPKIYFSDLGFVNSLINNFNNLNNRSEKGEIYESFVLQEHTKKEIKIKFWNKQLSEIDFIIEKNDTIIPIEVKSKIKKIPKAIKIFIEQYKITNAYILNETLDQKTKIDNVTVIATNLLNTPHLINNY